MEELVGGQVGERPADPVARPRTSRAGSARSGWFGVIRTPSPRPSSGLRCSSPCDVDPRPPSARGGAGLERVVGPAGDATRTGRTSAVEPIRELVDERLIGPWEDSRSRAAVRRGELSGTTGRARRAGGAGRPPPRTRRRADAHRRSTPGARTGTGTSSGRSPSPGATGPSGSSIAPSPGHRRHRPRADRQRLRPAVVKVPINERSRLVDRRPARPDRARAAGWPGRSSGSGARSAARSPGPPAGVAPRALVGHDEDEIRIHGRSWTRRARCRRSPSTLSDYRSRAPGARPHEKTDPMPTCRETGRRRPIAGRSRARFR